jgi:broad specificity phosphatase PhoE
VATFLLIRHGHMEAVGKWLAGRRSGIHLSDLGQRQVLSLADWLQHRQIQRLLSSPLERAQETGAPLAERWRLPVETHDALIEVDFGQWTGRTLHELENDPTWRNFNQFRSGTRIPGGESMHDGHPADHAIALVTHGDVIRAALCYCLGLSLDLIHRLEVDPASVSTVRLEAWGAVVTGMNTSPV